MLKHDDDQLLVEEKKATKAPDQEKRTRHGVPADLATAKAPAGAGACGAVPHFTYHGGPVVENPQIYIAFLGDWSSAANKTRAARLTQFVHDLLKAPYFHILAQYGCGTTGQVIREVTLPNANHNLTDADLHTILQQAFNTHVLPEPVNHSNVYILYLDDSTGITGSITMCEPRGDDAFGYHDFFTTAAGHPCYYAVIPGLTNACLQRSCPSDPGCSLHLAQTQEQRQTQVTSHEFSEMISDPQLNAWTDPQFGENGDICNGMSGTIAVGANTWTVQRMYSKLDDMISCGHTTCITGLPVLPAVPMARYLNPNITDHFYTTDLNELSYNSQGYHLESIQCYIFPTHVAGTVPLYRYYNLQATDHFYTTNWNELGQGAHGWTFEEIQGYVYPLHRGGTVPLYRYWNAGIADHLYTTNFNELGHGRNGYILEGTQCYVHSGI
jgi:hypothetical protein